MLVVASTGVFDAAVEGLEGAGQRASNLRSHIGIVRAR